MSRSCDVLFVPVNPRRAESPMASIAQGKRSDTLGKPPHHATPCKGKSKYNTLCFSTFALTGRNLHGNIIPKAPLRLRWAMNFCPFRACPLNAPHRKTDTSTLWGVPVLTSTHTTLRLRKSVPSAAPKARSVEAHHPERHLCKSVRSVGK